MSNNKRNSEIPLSQSIELQSVSWEKINEKGANSGFLFPGDGNVDGWKDVVRGFLFV